MSQSIRAISALHPNVQQLFRDFLDELREKTGQDIRISDTYRLKQRQNELFNSGASLVQFPYSWHNWGLAMDIYKYDNGKTSYNIQWNIVKELADKYHIEWGGDWKGFVDLSHLQYTEGLYIEDIIFNPDIRKTFNSILMTRELKILIEIMDREVPVSERVFREHDTVERCLDEIGLHRKFKPLLNAVEEFKKFKTDLKQIINNL